MFALARVFTDSFGQPTKNNLFTPPLIGNPANHQEIAALIALGFILLTPSVVKLMKTAFGAPQSAFGPIIEGLTGGVAIGAALGRPAFRRLYHVRRNPQTGEETREGLLGEVTNRLSLRTQGMGGIRQLVQLRRNFSAANLTTIRRNRPPRPPRTAPPAPPAAGGGPTAGPGP